VVLFRQLRNTLAAQVDAYAVAQVLSGAQTVTNSGSTFALTNGTTAGVGGFLKDVKTARNLLHDTAGVRLRADTLLAIGDFCDYIAAWNDAQGRPVFPAAWDDNRIPLRPGATGYVVSGLDMFADDNVPNSSGNVQVIVTKASEIMQLSGPVVPYVMPQDGGGSLEAVVGLRQYCTTIAKYVSGVAVISGTSGFYTASQFV